MLKKDGWQKKFLRVKQMADQNLGRAEKSEVLSDDLLLLEKRVDLIRQVCHNTQKSLSACIQGKGTDVEKRLKKMPESMLAHSMIESGQLLGTDTLMGKMFQLCGESEGSIAADLLQCEMEVEAKVLAPLQYIDNEIATIHKGRKQLTKTVLDMDSARARYNSAVKQTQGSGSASKAENIRDEMEEASQRMEQCRDQISTDIYTFVSKETEHCQMLIDLVNAQAQYHKKTLEVLEGLLPQLHVHMESASVSPVYGGSLEDHLKRMNRDISVVLEECICTLLMYGMNEEGLFRIAGSASKVKKLKAAFDSGMVDMRDFDSDIHTVAGAMKLYLRELPDPLMTCDLYQEWMQAANLPVEQRLQALWMVLDKLPKLNYNNLRYLIKFLAKLAENQEVNKMSPSNIAIVMGPNLMWAPGDGGPSMLSTSMQSAIVEILISHADWFFPEDIDFGLDSISPAHSGSNSSLLDSNQNININHDSATQSSRVFGAIADSVAPAMIIQTASESNTAAPARTSTGAEQPITPPSSMTASTNSLNSPVERGQLPSPKLSKRGVKKAPAPLPPGAPERPPMPAEKSASDAPHVTVSPPIEANKPPIPERPQAPPPIPPAPSEKLYPSLPATDEQKPEKPEKPSSPRPERPKAPPPDRPNFPPPEKPEKPPLPASMERHHPPSRPKLPKPELPAASGQIQRVDRLGTGSGRPPRPQPPPPPPPDQRTSQDNKAPIAEEEAVSLPDCGKNTSDASTYL